MTGPRGFFVTGTDTGVGKTWTSVTLMAALRIKQFSVLGMKPVASGCFNTQTGLVNEDAVLLRENASFAVPYRDVNPYAFEPAIAPHIAAQLAGVVVRFENIIARFEALRKLSDCVVVEGVGGWGVPLNENQTVADLASVLGLPVILVVGLRLGCLNHAILTYKSIVQAGQACVGWVANTVDPGFEYIEENVDTLKQNLDIPMLGWLPNRSELVPEALSQSLNINEILARRF